jgi:WD40 repeat protein
VTTCADGSLTWFDKTGDVLHRESSNHALLCCDYSPLGDFVVVGRDDFAVCVYDEETKKATHVHRPFI